MPKRSCILLKSTKYHKRGKENQMIYVALSIVTVFVIGMAIFVVGYQAVNSIIDSIDLDELD